MKTSLNNRHYLKQALEKLGFQYKEAKEGEAKLVTKGSYGVHESVDIVIQGNGKSNFNDSVGFRQNADGTFTAVGDFYNVTTQSGQHLSAQDFGCEVTAHSKEAELAERLMNLGFGTQDGRKETKDYIEVCFERVR
jgi:hypothetical protein